MSNLTLPPTGVTMTSREIAELTGKEHKHVMRDIRALQEQLGGMFLGVVQNWTHPQNGQEYEEFVLDKDTCLTLLLGYDAIARMKVVKRWQELESQAAQLKPPTELSHLEILRLAVDSGQRLIAAEEERDKAIRDAVVTVERVLHGLLGKASSGKVLQVSHRNSESPGAKRTRAWRERKKAAAGGEKQQPAPL